MKELVVHLNHFQKRIKLGTLAKKDSRVYFEFENPSYNISPYSLPPSSELKEFKNKKYGDIFGAFSDSLPDGWGLLLMDRQLKKQNYDYKGLTSFDRLEYLGDSAMGALEYSPSKSLSVNGEDNSINLYTLARNAVEVYEGTSDEVIDKLAKAGGSPGGARPKIVMIEKADGQFVSHTSKTHQNDKHWLVKFDVSKEFKDFSSVEYFYSLMAKECGIKMMPTKLLKDLKNNPYFATERFDRAGKNKIHMHTYGSLIESNFRTPDQDYRNIMLVTYDLTKNIKDVEKVFRLMVFNHLVTNQDDHVKNFSYVMDEEYNWHFAPAYDLTPSFGMNGWQATTINNKGTDITEDDYLEAIKGTGLNPTKCKEIIEEVQTGILESSKNKDLLLKKDFKTLLTDYLRL